jgi:uncharacterized membrane protein
VSSNREQILRWAEQGQFDNPNYQDKVSRALKLGYAEPDESDWLAFVKVCLIWGAIISFSAAIIFFFAFNWQDMSRFSKFALVEILLVSCALAYIKFSPKQLLNNGILLTLSLLVGGLLALVGQTYQTGADPWQLFAAWSVVILPWVVISRANSLWIMWLVLFNTALIAYFEVSDILIGLLLSNNEKLWVFTLLNTVLVVLFEKLSLNSFPRFIALLNKQQDYLAKGSKYRYVHRLTAVFAGIGVTLLATEAIFSQRASIAGLVFYVVWISAVYAFYRYHKKDLFVLSAASISAITVVVSGLIELLDSWLDDFGFLFVSLTIIILSALAAMHMRRLASEFFGKHPPTKQDNNYQTNSEERS